MIHKEIEVDLKSCSDVQLKNIARLTAYHMNVLIRNQDLTLDDYARILKVWGHKDKYGVWYEDQKYHQIQYVTHLKMEELGGKRGLFATGELDWHCNGLHAPDPEDCVTLYCVKPTKDRCDTIFLNGVEAYKDLPQDVKEKIEDVMIMITAPTRGFHKLEHEHLISRDERPKMMSSDRMYLIGEDQVTFEEQKDLEKVQGRYRSKGPIYQEMMRRKELYSTGGKWKYVFKKLVHTHHLTNQKGLYFPFLNIAGFYGIIEDEWQDLYEYLTDHYVKYSYSHDWKEGDLVLFDQTQAIHKRMPFPLDENGQQQDRLLWRGAFYYEDIK